MDIERKERLEKDRLELVECLNDMCEISKINEHVDILIFKHNYIITHWDLSDLELKERMEIIDDIFGVRKLKWKEQRLSIMREKGIESDQILDRLQSLV